jgi:uncharacterized protein
VEDGAFEWDDTKAESNWLDHGVTFDMAREAFKAPFAVEWIDDRQASNEPRVARLGVVESRLLFVAYTMRGGQIRLISARKAEPHERRRRHNENREI